MSSRSPGAPTAAQHSAEERSERASRVAAMLDRWESEDLRAEPDWDIEAIEPLVLRTRAVTRGGT